MRRAVDLGLSRRSNDERYYYLSIDEKAVHKGHDYISILSDEQSGVVLEVVDGRTEDSVDELCQTALTEEQRNEVRTVCTDMWQPYINPTCLHLGYNLHVFRNMQVAVFDYGGLQLSFWSFLTTCAFDGANI